MDWTNDNSDGWPYWNRPSNAAKGLQAWLYGWRKRYVNGDHTDIDEFLLGDAASDDPIIDVDKVHEWIKVICPV